MILDSTGLADGTYTAALTFALTAGRTPSVQVPVTLLVTGNRVGINSGGDAYTDAAGDVWLKDQKWVLGGFGYKGGAKKHTNRPIAGTVDDALYQTALENPDFYRFDNLPAGKYSLELLFAELDRKVTAGKRVFDVLVNGSVVLPGYDIAAAVGVETADNRAMTVDLPAGGSLTLTFAKHAHSKEPSVNALRLTQVQ